MHGRIYIVLAVLYCIVIVRILIIVQCIQNTVVVFMASNTAVFTTVILLTTLSTMNQMVALSVESSNVYASTTQRAFHFPG